MFNKINKIKAFIAFGVIGVLGLIFLGAMIRFSGITDKTDRKLLLKNAKQSYLDGEYNKALNMYERILVLEPGNDKAVLDLAILYDDIFDQDKKAADLYRKYLNLAPNTNKRQLVETWIKEISLETPTSKNNPDEEKIKLLQQELEASKKENALLNKEVESLTGKLYTIQADLQTEINNLQKEKERLIGDLNDTKLRINQLTNSLASAEKSRSLLLKKLEEKIEAERIKKQETKIKEQETKSKDAKKTLKESK